MCRGKNRFVAVLPHREPGPHPTSKELLMERSIAKEREPFATELEQSRIEETHARQSIIPTDPVYYMKATPPERMFYTVSSRKTRVQRRRRY